MTASKKALRNHVLDIWKFLGCLLVALHHWMNVSMPNGYVEGTDYFGKAILTGDIGFKYPLGAYTLGFFTFTTGYWLMNAYQKAKKAKAFGQGYDMELVYRYTAKNYVAYMPLCFITTTCAWLTANVLAKTPLKIWWDTFVWDIWEFIGLSGFGIWMNLSSWGDVNHNGMFYAMFGMPLAENTPYSFSPITWYLGALICFCCVFYVLLVLNEKMTVYAILPIFFAMCMYSNNGYVALQYGTNTAQGIYKLLNSDFARLWGPACVGMWGWYAIQALQKVQLSEGTKRFMAFLHLFLTVTALISIWVGYTGGMINFDAHLILIVILTLANRDAYTQKVNEFLAKVPFIGELANVGLGIFLIHPSLFAIGVAKWLPVYGLARSTVMFLGCCLAAGILYVPFNRFVVSPLQKKMTKLLGLNTPVGEMLPK